MIVYSETEFESISEAMDWVKENHPEWLDEDGAIREDVFEPIHLHQGV